MTSAPSQWTARARAVVLTIVLVIHGTAVLPLPHTVTADDLKNPVTQDEIARWAERLTALGYTIDAGALGERVRDVSGAIGGAHRAVLAPVRPWFRITGTGQGWALFANPDTHPSRLSIRVRRGVGAAWEPLYERFHPTAVWLEPVLSYRRVRGCYDAGGPRNRPRGPYKRFAEWVGARALAVDPAIDLVEVRTLRTHTTLPGQPPDPAVEVRHVVPVRR